MRSEIQGGLMGMLIGIAAAAFVIVLALALTGCAPIDWRCAVDNGSDQPAYCRSGR